MGNCIGAAFEKVSHDEAGKELKVSAIVDEKFSSGPSSGTPLSEVFKPPLSFSAVLKSGEIYCLIPQLIQQHSVQTPADMAKDGNGQRVKIVVTRKQLELLMRRKEQLKLRHITVQSLVRKVQKWRPSLAAIPEL